MSAERPPTRTPENRSEQVPTSAERSFDVSQDAGQAPQAIVEVRQQQARPPENTAAAPAAQAHHESSHGHGGGGLLGTAWAVVNYLVLKVGLNWLKSLPSMWTGGGGGGGAKKSSGGGHGHGDHSGGHH